MTRSAEIKARRKLILKRVAMAMSLLSVALVLIVMFLIVRTERAHDEVSCPFVNHSQRTVGQTRVVEESRKCLPEMEERRYLVERAGRPSFELARKRLPPAHFLDSRYKWTLREDKAQKVVLRIDIDDKLSSEFFEEDVPQ